MTQSKNDSTITITGLNPTDDVHLTIEDETVYDLDTYNSSQSGEISMAYDSYTTGKDDDIVVNITGSGTDTVTFDVGSLFSGDADLDLSNITFGNSEDFIDHLPSIDRVRKMCEIYPGLQKAYENFEVLYKMVNQDYEGKKKAGEIDDDELPF